MDVQSKTLRFELTDPISVAEPSQFDILNNNQLEKVIIFLIFDLLILIIIIFLKKNYEK